MQTYCIQWNRSLEIVGCFPCHSSHWIDGNTLCERGLECDETVSSDRIFSTYMQLNKNLEFIYAFGYTESGGGGSYHCIRTLSVFDNLQFVLIEASDCYTDDHYHLENCDECREQGEAVCKQKAMDEFEQSGSLDYLGSHENYIWYSKIPVLQPRRSKRKKTN